MKLWKNNGPDFEYEPHLRDLHSESFAWALACVRSDSMLAEDVIQTVYLKILEGKARFKQQSAFKTWLFSVIKFTAIDALRSRGVVAEWLLEKDDVACEENSDSFPTEKKALIDAAFTQLSPKQALVLQLVFYHDQSIEEASEVMHIALGTARTHYERGKKRLRDLLEKSQEMKELLR